MSIKPKGDPFYLYQEENGFIILEILESSNRVGGYNYRVKATSCGHEQELLHRSIQARKNRKHKGLCTKCIRVKMAHRMVADRNKKYAEAKKHPQKKTNPKSLTELALAMMPASRLQENERVF